MIKKYLPFIALIAAACLFYWIKTHQRGVDLHIQDNTAVPSTTSSMPHDEAGTLDRSIKNIAYSKHALCRMDCRHIDESEVKEIVKDGIINYSKVEETDKGKTFPLEGITHDKQHVRIVVAPHADELVVVTVIDLDTEWPCDCK